MYVLGVTTRQSGRLTPAQVTCHLAAFAQGRSGANHPSLTQQGTKAAVAQQSTAVSE